MPWATFTEEPQCPLVLFASAGELSEIRFGSGMSPASEQEPDHPVLRETARQLKLYFAGSLRCFNLPLKPNGTEFQQRVWQALLQIPYSETRSYGEIAQQIGSIKAVRAVGAANGRNPIPIVIPCHRVIGANGKLTGFGGGLPLKRYLLKLEQDQCLLTDTI